MQQILNSEHTPKSLLALVLMVLGAIDALQLLMIRLSEFWHFAHNWWINL